MNKSEKIKSYSIMGVSLASAITFCVVFSILISAFPADVPLIFNNINGVISNIKTIPIYVICMIPVVPLIAAILLFVKSAKYEQVKSVYVANGVSIALTAIFVLIGALVILTANNLIAL